MWKNAVDSGPDSEDGVGTFEIKLFEATGDIEVHYQSVFTDPDDTGDVVAGIESAQNNDGQMEGVPVLLQRLLLRRRR